MRNILQYVHSRLESTGLKKRIVSGTIWGVGGAILERSATLLLSVLIVRTLGREEFGEFALIQSTVAMFAVFANLGVAVTATKYTAQYKRSDPEKLSQILGFLFRFVFFGALFVSITLVLMSDYVSNHVLDNGGLSFYLILVSIALFFNTINGYQGGCLIGFEELKKYAAFSSVSVVLSIPVSLALATQYGLSGAVCGLVVTSLLRWSIAHLLLDRSKKKWNILRPEKVAIDWEVLKGFALPALISGLMLAPAHWICHALLVNTVGGRSEMALIGITNQWFYALMFLPIAANRIVLPLLADKEIKGSAYKTFTLLKLSVLSNLLFSVPVVCVLSIFSPHIMSLYGPGYSEHWLVLVISLAAGFLSVLALPLGQLIVAEGRMWLGVLMNLVWALTYILLSWCLINYGALGVVMALAISYSLHLIWSFVVVVKVRSLKEQF